jgi:hypothetical protein
MAIQFRQKHPGQIAEGIEDHAARSQRGEGFVTSHGDRSGGVRASAWRRPRPVGVLIEAERIRQALDEPVAFRPLLVGRE